MFFKTAPSTNLEISVITPGKRFVALCNAFAHFFVDSYGKAELIATPINEVNFISWENYKRFITENPKYYQQTESRIISYWNEYYRRRFPKLKNYVGRIIFDQINTKEIGKRQDEIVEVGIDKSERLFILSKKEGFTLDVLMVYGHDILQRIFYPLKRIKSYK